MNARPSLLIAALSTLAGLTISLASLMSFVCRDWFFDTCSNFRLLYFVALPICLVCLLFLRLRVVALFCALAWLANSIPVLILLTPIHCNLETTKTVPLTILAFNTEFQNNSDYAAFTQLVKSRDPDIVALVEVDRTWIKALEQSLHNYPFRKVVLQGNGLALFSKYPLEQIEVRYFRTSEHPRIISKIDLGSKQIDFMIAHPRAPRDRIAFSERNQEMSTIADELRNRANPTILIADLNCAPWSCWFHRLLEAGLCDTQQGFGVQPSWPARTGRVLKNVAIPPLIPIDHILVSKNICVLQRQAGPSINSDHLPVFVKLLVPKE